MPQLTDIRAFVFDAYGTLFDVHSAVGKHRERIGAQADALSALWRTKQLEYTWLRSLMHAHADFWQVTGDALDYAMDTCDVNDLDLRRDLMQAYLELDCYPEVPATLQALQALGMKMAILSNGTPQMLAAAVENSGIGAYLDAVWSIEDVGIYKPDPSVYQIACDRLKLDPAQISFQSSNAWDIAGAAQFGLTPVWINRFNQKRERLPKGAQAELQSLDGLPALVRPA